MKKRDKKMNTEKERKTQKVTEKEKEKEKWKRRNRETSHEKIIDILIKLNERIFISSSTHLFL